jgi:NAD(P)-dependent dehydrogenase (short-subunit alcohol dehydrogenase family)
MATSLQPLDGRVVIVTGASSGMGRATAVAADGAHVLQAARRADLLAQTGAAISHAGGRAWAVPGDLTRRATSLWSAVGGLPVMTIWGGSCPASRPGKVNNMVARGMRRSDDTSVK